MKNLTDAQHAAKYGFRSQAEAVREARIAIWGDVSFAKRECVKIEKADHWGIHVAAMVNGRLVTIDFDNYGRVSAGGVKVVA